MIKTIHWYITRDLVKIWVLALFALTLLMTIFSVIEPLRKQQGITFEQILSFFGYMMPSMFSMTLPISALFAATITYGRFSQDNEHLACRAGGVSTMAILRPAILLGVIVTIMSLGLSNYVAPGMIKRSMAVLTKNPKKLIYRQLETRHYWQWKNHFVHADRVDAENDILHGLIYFQWSPTRREGVQVDDKVRLADVYTVTRIDGDAHHLAGADGQALAPVGRDALLPVVGHRDDDLAAGDRVWMSDVWRIRKINPDNTYDIFLGTQTLPGVPARDLIPLPKLREARIMVAAQAKVTLRDDATEPFVELDFVDLVATRTAEGAGNIISEGQHQRLRFVLDNPMRDRAPWMTWDELVAVSADPVRSPMIMRELEKTRRDLRNESFLQDLRQQIEERREYRRLSGVTAMASGPPVTREFVLKADRFEETVGRRDQFSLGCRLSNADGSPVQMEIWEVRDVGNGDEVRQERWLRQTVSSKPGGNMAVGVEYDELTDLSNVYLSMPGEVDVVTAGDPRPQRFEDFSVGQLAIPRELLHLVDGYDYAALFTGTDAAGRALSNRSLIRDRIRDTTKMADELKRAIKAETHVRLAYSSSCLLMVMLGAALGLMFRGGQFLTAFATAAVPGTIVVVFLLMGKGIVKKVDGGDYGLLAIWGGIVFLAVATSIVYVRLARR